MLNLNHSKHLVVIRNNTNSKDSIGISPLKFALSNKPVSDIVLSGLSKGPLSGNNGSAVIAVPESWKIVSDKVTVESYKADIPICLDDFKENEKKTWFVISNGRFIAKNNERILQDVLADISADVIVVNADPGLLAYREKIRLISENKIASCCRQYFDSAEPTSIPIDWPHYIFIKTDVLKDVFTDYTLPCSFSDFIKRCSGLLKVCAVNIAGVAFDLENEDGLFDFCNAHFNSLSGDIFSVNDRGINKPISENSTERAPSNTKLVGKVLLGENVQLGANTVIVGPTIICNGSKIGSGAVINSSIIGSNVSVPKNQLLFNRVIKEQKNDWNMLSNVKNRKSGQTSFVDLKRLSCANSEFESWSRFSYARFFKRIGDFIVSLAVIILFAPIFPVIALVIKLTSHGPVFFKDKRQGLHGKEFNCLKFRTMVVGADKIQDKLRFVNQLDGPQFKIENDPRISTVGKFLRDTCIDEIPQFFNVLLGQMSVVGPRPSPKSENTIRPSWRYARLSVRPGITGLWQVCRTREASKDFQEWIYYDTKYVRSLSLRIDLWICWRTARHLTESFLRQF